MSIEYDETLRYRGTLDLSASEVDELFHAVMHHRDRLSARIAGTPVNSVARPTLQQQYIDTEHLLVTLRRELKRCSPNTK